VSTDDAYEFYTDPEALHLRARLKGGVQVCDFCLKADPEWTYPAGPVEIVGHPVYTDSDDDWGACDDCHSAIERDDIGHLVYRMVRLQPIHGHIHADELESDEIRAAIALVNARRFMLARSGPPYRS
jgi:hypothetical protein